MRPLTEKQREALEFIAATIRHTHRPPTIMELSLHMGSSGSSRRGLGHIEALVRKGYITREPGQARSLRLTRAAEDLLEKGSPSSAREIPLLREEMSGGLPETTIKVPGFLLGASPDFAFRLDREASFPDKRIDRGDILLIEKSPTWMPGSGDIVVVEDPLLGKLTLGIVSKKYGLFALTPPGERPQRHELRKKDLIQRIRGRVVGLIRPLLPDTAHLPPPGKGKDSPDER
ncbi:MAG: LexA family protein [Leptospirillia bacterium]